MIWLRHQDIFFLYVCLLKPLNKCPGPIKNNVSLIRPVGERVGDEGGDLVDELVGLPGVQDPGEPAHVGAARLPPRLLEPVVHDAALPRVVHGPRRGHRGVEQPPPAFAAGAGGEAAGGGRGGGGGGGGGEGGGGEGQE